MYDIPILGPVLVLPPNLKPQSEADNIILINLKIILVCHGFPVQENCSSFTEIKGNKISQEITLKYLINKK